MQVTFCMRAMMFISWLIPRYCAVSRPSMVSIAHRYLQTPSIYTMVPIGPLGKWSLLATFHVLLNIFRTVVRHCPLYTMATACLGTSSCVVNCLLRVNGSVGPTSMCVCVKLIMKSQILTSRSGPLLLTQIVLCWVWIACIYCQI